MGALTGQADTVATITGLAPDTATTQANQPSITTAANLTTVGALDSGAITSGFTSIDVGSGVITGGTVEATTDTSAGDNAAMGYTSAEGLILTGQGSTDDVTIKNDADTMVLRVPTGTTGVTFAGVITATSPSFTTPVLGTPSSGNLSNCTAYEGSAVLSTGEGGGTKFLREDGDGTCSWQSPAGGGDLLADGSVPLTANWDVGAFTITGTQFISDIATGTAPFVVSSATEVANLQSATVGTITGLAPDTATTQATQAAITTAANLVTVGALDFWFHYVRFWLHRQWCFRDNHYWNHYWWNCRSYRRYFRRG